MLEDRWFGTIASDDLLRVHCPVVGTTRATYDVREPGVCIDKRRFHLEGGLVIHSVAMNDVGHLKSSKAYFSDALQLVVKLIPFDLRVDVGKHAQVEGDELDNKLKRIREIRLAGFEVAHVIHRHGMDDKTAFEVEAALIDAYPGLTNIVGGSGSTDYGAMHAKEIITRYCAEPAVFQHRALLISVNRSATETSLYESTRYAWKISKTKAKQAEVILATQQGLIVGVF